MTAEPAPVAIDGVGIRSPLGSCVSEHVKGLEHGASVLGPPRWSMHPDTSSWPVAEIHPDEWGGPEPKYVEMAVAACLEAMAQAAVDPTGVDLLVLGTAAGPRVPSDWTLGGLAAPGASIDDDLAVALGTRLVADKLGLSCPLLTVSTACSSGAAAIAHAWHQLRTGRVRTALCVGLEELWIGSVLSFGMIGALSAEPCSPYGRSDGTSLGEGAGALVLSSGGSEGRALGFVTGVGQSTDAYHPSRPDPTAAAPFLAVDRALSVARWQGPLSLVSGHGTGTRANDRVEQKLSELMLERQGTDHEKRPPTFSSKVLYGHSFGASSTLETIELLLALRGELSISKLALLDGPADIAPGDPRVGIKNAFAMGGLNTSLVIASAAEPTAAAPVGVAALSVGELRASEMRFAGPLRRDGTAGSTPAGVPIAHGEAFSWAQARCKRSRWTTFDTLTRLTAVLVAGLLAEVDGLVDRRDIGLFVATERGPARSWRKATRALQGGGDLSPDIVPNLSRHALVANTSEFFGLQGPTTAFYLSSKDGRQVLTAAVSAIESGCARALLVIEVDESLGEETMSGAPPGDESARGCLLVDSRVVDGSGLRGLWSPDDSSSLDAISDLVTVTADASR